MEIKTVGLIGPGAVGAYFVWGFSQASDISFAVCAEGERKARLEKNGVRVNGETYFPVVKTPEEMKGVDLLFVSVKYNALPEAAAMAKKIVTDSTVVISLMNGIDSEEIIGDAVGREHMLYAFMRIISRRNDQGVFFEPEITEGLYFGEKNGEVNSERMQAVKAALDKTPLHYVPKEDIIVSMWMKYKENIRHNLPQAILAVGGGAYDDSEHMAYLRDRMEQEVDLVAHSLGIATTKLPHWNPGNLKFARFSTLQDLDAGRKTEVDMFLGVLLRLAEEQGLEVPFCDYTYHAIKVLEEKNEGKFDY